MTDLTRQAGDPLGIVVPATVECDACHGTTSVGVGGFDSLSACHLCTDGRIPNPAAWQTCQTCDGGGSLPVAEEHCANCGGDRFVGKATVGSDGTGWTIPCPLCVVEGKHVRSVDGELPIGWEWLNGNRANCPDCNGQGVTPRTLMIPEAVQVVELHDVSRTRGLGIAVDYGATVEPTPRVWLFDDRGPAVDITRLWPEERCLECAECARTGDGECESARCNGDGTVRTLPKPGEWWIVGHRPCELLPVVDPHGNWPTDEGARFFTVEGELIMLYTVDADAEDGYDWEDLSDYGDGSHFPDVLPTTDDLAGVCGELVLADKLRELVA